MRDQEIQDYLQGKLSADARLSFEKQMESDVSFASEVREIQNLKLAIETSEREDLKNRLQQLERSKTRKAWFGKLAMAASVVVIIGLGSLLFLGRSTGKTLYADNFEVYPNVMAPITRSSEPTMKEDYYFVAYEKGEYAEAIVGFKQLLEEDDNQDVRFYLGMALLNNGDKDKALNELQKIDKEKTDFHPQNLWYQALIHLEKENYIEARELLQKLIENETNYKKKEAKEIFNKL